MEALAYLKEVPLSIIAGKSFCSAGMIKDKLTKFTKKLTELIVKHMFHLNGPLVFGCCPEDAFFPMQMYNVFTALAKVDKFKTVAKGYPAWLCTIGHEKFTENEYYMCAQGYLTIHEFALFNICNPMSLIYTNPLYMMGLLPRDWPLCFYGCSKKLFYLLTP